MATLFLQALAITAMPPVLSLWFASIFLWINHQVAYSNVIVNVEIYNIQVTKFLRRSDAMPDI